MKQINTLQIESITLIESKPFYDSVFCPNVIYLSHEKGERLSYFAKLKKHFPKFIFFNDEYYEEDILHLPFSEHEYYTRTELNEKYLLEYSDVTYIDKDKNVLYLKPYIKIHTVDNNYYEFFDTVEEAKQRIIQIEECKSYIDLKNY